MSPASQPAESQGAKSTALVPNDKNFVQSVERAAMVLDALADAGSPLSVLELSRRTHLHRTAVHRLVNTLARRKLVSVEDGRCRLAAGICRLGAAYLEASPLRRVALPYVVELHRRLGYDQPWVASLVLVADVEIVILDRMWGVDAPLETILDVGSRFALDEGASGIAALAYLDRSDGVARIGEERLAALEDQFEAVRRRGGVAFYQSLAQPDLYGIAGCVRDARDRPVGAITVTGALADQLSDDSDVVTQVRRVARHVETTLRAQTATGRR